MDGRPDVKLTPESWPGSPKNPDEHDNSLPVVIRTNGAPRCVLLRGTWPAPDMPSGCLP